MSEADQTAQLLYNKLNLLTTKNIIDNSTIKIIESMIERFRAVLKGHIHADIIISQLKSTPLEVQAFFTEFSNTSIVEAEDEDEDEDYIKIKSTIRRFKIK